MRSLIYLALLSLSALASAASTKPNIIVILADDIGYGDFSCYGAHRAATPHVDKLAAQGLRFTDAHCAAATCTPTRYALMTGEYPWRKKGTGILPGDAALIIPPGSYSLPAMLQKAGYKTAAVGKWHLGLGSETGAQDWNKEIKPGPREMGFDYSFLIPATGDRTPCVFVENQRVVGLDPSDPLAVGYKSPVGSEPRGSDHPELLKMKYSYGHDQTIVNGVSRIGTMAGAKAARWVDEDIADTLATKAVAFIAQQSKAQPFFLYFATHDIHVPRMPNARFVGKSGMGPRGDALLEFDFQVGEVLAALEKQGIADDTLVILSSDNGPVLDDGYQDQAVTALGNHKPAGPLRGGKGSNFEAGTRVPFIVRWPGHVTPGTSDALVCQIDFIASLGALVGLGKPAGTAPDSLNILPALLGLSPVGRDHLVEDASRRSLRMGQWKYIPGLPGKGKGKNNGRGGNGNETGNADEPQLYDLATDLGETTNLAAKMPSKVAEMQARLVEIMK